MDDARRFLRYLVPGSLLFLETGLLLFGLVPDWTIGLYKKSAEFDSGKTLSLAIAFVVTSGVLGFLLSMIHHTLFWLLPFRYPAVDYRQLIEDLRNEELIDDPFPKMRGDRESVVDAWVILTKLWHERVKSSPRIEGANNRADRLSDLVHSIGACRIALAVACCIAVVFVIDQGWRGEVVFKISDYWISATLSLAAGIGLLVCSHINYRQTHSIAQNFVYRTIRAALENEPKGRKEL